MAEYPLRVRMFGLLDAYRRERGLPSTATVDIPEEGLTARELAERLELPLDRIEGVFCNHVVYKLGHLIHPGDEVAFVPYGTPGPHRFFLGLYEAGKGAEGGE